MPSVSIAFSSDGDVLGTYSGSILSAGNLTYENTTVLYIHRNVSTVQSDAFMSCQKLMDIYINQPSQGQRHVEFQNDSLPPNKDI